MSSDEIQRLRSKIAANERWSTVSDRTEATEPARQAFLARFEAQVDPNGELDGETRARLAENARSAYFQRLALASAKARAAKRRRRADATAAAEQDALLREARSAGVDPDEIARITGEAS